MNNLRRENEELKLQVTLKTKLVNKFKNQWIELSGQIEQQKEEADKKLKTERRNAFAAYCRSQGINFEKQVQDLTNRNNELLNENKLLQERRNELEEHTVAITEEITVLEGKIVTLQDELTEVTNDVNRHVDQIQQLETRRTELEDLLSTSIQQCQELERKNSQLQQELQHERHRFGIDLKKLEEEQKKARNHLSHVEGVLTISNQHNDRVTKDHDTLLQEHKVLKEKLQETLNELGVCKSSLHVRRSGHLYIPSSWEEMPDNINCKSFPVTPEEYEKVSRRFFDTLDNIQAKILKMDRIQNRCLYQQYMLKKEQICVNSKSAREMLLWHGTFGEAVSGIIVNGFDRGYQGVNGTVYGKGVYFSTTSSYSVGYSKDDRHKEKKMFLARVLTGDRVCGKSQYEVLPIKDHSSFTRYDSLVNSETNPSIYVVMNDTQAYPEYLVTYELTDNH